VAVLLNTVLSMTIMWQTEGSFSFTLLMPLVGRPIVIGELRGT
jgi:hypothetical protein